MPDSFETVTAASVTDADRLSLARSAADVESAQRRRQFTDPRLAQTTIDEWIRAWLEAHRVADSTWATYDSHIRNHILPRWSGTALGDIPADRGERVVNKKLRPKLADKSVQDILVLFSMIFGEAVDEGLIGANPCRKTADHLRRTTRGASRHHGRGGRARWADGTRCRAVDHHRRLYRAAVG